MGKRKSMKIAQDLNQYLFGSANDQNCYRIEDKTIYIHWRQWKHFIYNHVLF